MGTTSARGTGEVAIEALEPFLDPLKARQINLETIVFGTQLEKLTPKEWPRRVSWADYHCFVERVQTALGGKEAMERIGSDLLETPTLGPLIHVAGLVASVSSLYWVASYFGGRRLFSNIISDFREITPNRSVFTITIPEPYPLTEAYFAVNAGSLRALPRVLALPDSVVRYFIKDRVCTYEIEHAPSRTLFARFRRLLLLLTSARSIYQELKVQNEELLERLSELQAANAAAEEGRKAAEAANKAKAEFLRNISHELRTPMNGISGGVELLQNGADPHVWGDLNDSAQKMKSLVEELIEVSTLESDAAAPVFEDIVPNLLVKEALKDYHRMAALKNGFVQVSIDPRLPARLQADPIALQRILGHLVENGIFHGGGRVSVRFFALAPGWLRVEVEDEGPGVDKAHEITIFGFFSQADGSLTRRQGGLGLGLAVAKRRVSLLGGRIGLEKGAVGARFYFEVPYRASAAPVAPVLEAPQRALVVEDDPVSGRLLRRIVEKAGWQVVWVEDGQKALDMLEQQMFAVVFMDCQMPVMDGLTATRQIRQKGLQVPIYAVTAHGLSEERERCLAAGMNLVIDKPVSGTKIVALLGELATKNVGSAGA